MRGLRVRWDVGPRTQIESRDLKGRLVIRNGKNGGPVIQQTVVKHLEPKDAPAHTA